MLNQKTMDKSLILNDIKKHLGFKKDIDFASFLGINQSTLSAWHKRGSINYELIITKCKDIDGNWLLTGKGSMLKKQYKEDENSFDLSKEIISTLKSNLETKDKYIQKLEEEIQRLKKEVDLLKKDNSQ